jgi:hypothetical protein
MTYLAVTEAPSWSAIADSIGKLSLIGFRGQADAKWSLETTLYREGLRQQIPTEALPARESWLLYQFSRFAHQHKTDLPEKEDVLDWLALIQHYGGPTRLLDFTYSIYVAAFFAIETATADAAIWMMQLHWLHQTLQKRFEYNVTGRIDQMRRAANAKLQEHIASGSTVEAVIHVEPDRMHERLWIQQGLFLAPVNTGMPFMQNLAGTFNPELKILPEREMAWDDFISQRSLVGKIILPRNLHREIKRALMAANINAATLFPGLEGFARSLRFRV